MNVEISKQFLDVFKDFLVLFGTEHWPSDATDAAEIRKVYDTAKFIEKCVTKLHERQMLDTFLSQINSPHKQCLTDPAGYILKKLMRAKVDLSIVDTATTLFIEMFDEKRFEDCLVAMMSEKASEDVIIESYQFNPKDAMEVKCQLLLSSINDEENSLDSVLKEGNEDITKILLACLMIREVKYQKQLDIVKSVIARALCNKSAQYKQLWRIILIDNKDSLVKICSEHSEIFFSVVNALVDAGKVIKENIATDYYYIDITYSELVEAVKCLCTDPDLKDDLMNTVKLAESEKTFWDIVFSKI